MGFWAGIDRSLLWEKKKEEVYGKQNQRCGAIKQESVLSFLELKRDKTQTLLAFLHAPPTRSLDEPDRL